MNLTIQEIANMLAIEGITDTRCIEQVEFDSRKINQNALFVPLPGTRDGHEFAQAAIEQGAIAMLWSQSLDLAPKMKEVVILPVEDVTKAFQQLAKAYRQKINPKVVAITGSNGKTTTKDMTESVLAQKYRTYKTQGNYNNDLGVPYTILHMPSDTEILILEMGMDHAGEIAFLSALGQPDAAAITLVGEAHLENLGSRANIAKAKLEIVTGLKANGLLLIPADEGLLTPLVQNLSQDIWTFGLEQGTLSAKITQEDRQQTTFTVEGESLTIPVLGGYNVKNALIAYGFGKYFGLSIEQIRQGLNQVELTKNRTQWLKAKNGAALLSDVYNANPTAMGLVLDSFARLDLPGRRLACLADMLELGPDSLAMHAQMAQHIKQAYDKVYLYGEQMRALKEALAQQNVDYAYFAANEKADLIACLQKELQPTDSLLLKGSNGMGLQAVVQTLIEEIKAD